MQGTGAMLGQAPLMVGGAIALVIRETVFGIYRMHLIHIPISGCLRQNGCGADGRLRGIAADDPALIDGWHAADRDGRGAIWRWTDGDAAIPLAAADVPLVVTIAICGVMTYRLADAVVDVGPERRAARG